MNTLLSLITKINNFHKKATLSYLRSLGAPQGTWTSPDDPEEDEGLDAGADLGLYSKIQNAARQISNADIASEVLLIGDLYKKSIEVGGGFNFVNKAVSNLVNLLDDEDDDEQSSVEDLMNEVSRDLRNRAKSTPQGDDDVTIKALQESKRQFNNKMINQDLESDEPSAFEAGLTQYEEGAEGTFDPTGGVSGEVAQTKGRGYRVERKSFKDWVQSYENERQRFLHELTAPELQLSRTGLEARRNTASRTNLEELVKILGQMRDLTAKAIELETQVQAAPDPAIQATLDKIREMLRQLQTRRLSLKKNLRNHQYTQQVKSLENDLSASRTAQEKFLIQQKIELQKLMMSSDKGKDEESKWRRVLINSMSGGNTLPAEQISKINEKIQDGAAKKIKATEINRQKAEQVAELKGTKGPINTKQERLEGNTRRNQYDMDAIPLDGLTEHLTQRLATERVVVKQKITDKMKKAQQDSSLLKPFMDDVAKAATKKDKSALLAAAGRLKQKMVEFKNVQPEVVSYIMSLRTSKFFYGFRDKIKTISQWVGNDLSPEQMSFVQDTIRDGIKLSDFYKDLKIKPITPGWSERSTHYKPPVEIIEKIVRNLKGLINE